MDFKVAIDGPAGSGKSTVSNLVAHQLGFIHIDTGAMYRALTLEALNRKITLTDETAYDFIDSVQIEYVNDRIFLNGNDVTESIRSKKVTTNVSTVAKIGVVREKMCEVQRRVASHGKVIMDGRDIGSNVLTDADLKIFLIADIDCRAKRRLADIEKVSGKQSLEEIKEDILKRDEADYNRKISPLKKATDAVVVDTTTFAIEDTVKKIVELINERMNQNGIQF